jgi:hypothetical protein
MVPAPPLAASPSRASPGWEWMIRRAYPLTPLCQGTGGGAWWLATSQAWQAPPHGALVIAKCSVSHFLHSHEPGKAGAVALVAPLG